MAKCKVTIGLQHQISVPVVRIAVVKISISQHCSDRLYEYIVTCDSNKTEKYNLKIITSLYH